LDVKARKPSSQVGIYDRYVNGCVRSAGFPTSYTCSAYHLHYRTLSSVSLYTDDLGYDYGLDCRNLSPGAEKNHIQSNCFIETVSN